MRPPLVLVVHCDHADETGSGLRNARLSSTLNVGPTRLLRVAATTVGLLRENPERGLTISVAVAGLAVRW
jgi:hypothetical protein